MFSKEMVWENKETFGCEYLKLFTKENAILAESTVIYLDRNSPMQIDYHMEFDDLWRTKSVNITDRTGKALQITSSGKGEWFDRHGNGLDELTGAIDVDLSATPFTNSLPINRLDWKPNQKREFEMVYVSVPALDVQKTNQSYTFIKSIGKNRVFNFQSQDFESFITFDEKGFVVDYPQLFIRRL
ncbi:putative glycolipid-binding domain-containing protein [Planococcus shenhongbingii]|uniref:putative glycolipid-binding domain-containing protein n=1 Tax=Planococcus shenhongbingii TaxID=3058398 RepID=UPI00263211A3|nr:putative glycolipid-binding domain-containing protein [Planococcus sp. N016]WKA57031.1 putative glycolipid-binding domain-containing protein [Planococcus sp. N016]